MYIERSSIQVEWDTKKKTVIALIHPDGTRQETGVEPSGSVWTRLAPLDIAYPDGYHPRLDSLLGHSTFEEQPYTDAILQTFPGADFHPDQIFNIALMVLRQRAREILNATDWYLIRHLDIGTQIPEEIKEIRKQTRVAADLDEEDLRSRSPSEYIEFVPSNLESIAKETDVLLGYVPASHFEGDHHA